MKMALKLQEDLLSLRSSDLLLKSNELLEHEPKLHSMLKPKVCFMTFLYESSSDCLIIKQTLIFCVFNHGSLINPSPTEAAYWSSFHRHHSCLVFVILDSLSITIEEKYVTLMRNDYWNSSTSILVWISHIFTARTRRLPEGNVFPPVCLLMSGGGGFP